MNAIVFSRFNSMEAVFAAIIASTGTRHRDPGAGWRDQKWNSDGHYWEIGYAETPFRRVLDAIKIGCDPDIRFWRVPENHYHRFFRCGLSVPQHADT